MENCTEKVINWIFHSYGDGIVLSKLYLQVIKLHRSNTILNVEKQDFKYK